MLPSPADAHLRMQDVEYRGAKASSELQRLQKLVDDGGTPLLQVWRDADEWSSYTKLGDAVLHIDLAKRNQLLLIAPLCANTLGNAALGLCPNLLCSLLRAWQYDLEGGPRNHADANSGLASDRFACAVGRGFHNPFS